MRAMKRGDGPRVSITRWNASPAPSREALSACLARLLPTMSFEEIAGRLAPFGLDLENANDEMQIMLLSGKCVHENHLSVRLKSGERTVFELHGGHPPVGEWLSRMRERVEIWASGRTIVEEAVASGLEKIWISEHPWLTDDDLKPIPSGLTQVELVDVPRITADGIARWVEASPDITEVRMLRLPLVTPAEIGTLRERFPRVDFLAEGEVSWLWIDFDTLREVPPEYLALHRGLEHLIISQKQVLDERALTDLPSNRRDLRSLVAMQELTLNGIDLDGLDHLQLPEGLQTLSLSRFSKTVVLARLDQLFPKLNRLSLTCGDPDSVLTTVFPASLKVLALWGYSYEVLKGLFERLPPGLEKVVMTECSRIGLLDYLRLWWRGVRFGNY